MSQFHLHIGHIGLLDAAPLLVAQERGYFVGEGLQVTLSCQLGLATLCGKLADYRLHGACLPAPLPLLLSLGKGVPRVSMQVVSVCACQGMGIVMASSRPAARTAPLRIGVTTPGSAARLLWHRHQQLAANGSLAEAVLVPMAAGQLVDFLLEGMLDGFCGMDPLPALACLQGSGEIVADSAGLFPLHPGSVVALRADVAESQPQAAAALDRALTRACADCADPANRHELWQLLLAQCPYTDLSPALKAALADPPDDDPSGRTSMRFESPADRGGGLPAAAETFLEAACRSAIGPSARSMDIKAEIARVFGRQWPGDLPALRQVAEA
ncbi:nitrate transporter [Opitutaceae bacterium TAV5]|nr:nitrate transporter [Opitutaceae bacterium TAV5]